MIKNKKFILFGLCFIIFSSAFLSLIDISGRSIGEDSAIVEEYNDDNNAVMPSGVYKNYLLDSPSVFGEFSYGRGENFLVGDILTDNGDVAETRATPDSVYTYPEYSTTEWPDQDVTTEWDKIVLPGKTITSGTHESALDDATWDNLVIRGATNNLYDEFEVSGSFSDVYSISSVTVTAEVAMHGTFNNILCYLYTGSWQPASKSLSVTRDNNYHTVAQTWTTPTGTDLNGLKVRVRTSFPYSGVWAEINYLKIDITYTKEVMVTDYLDDVYATWQPLIGSNFEACEEIQYKFRQNVSGINLRFGVYNWDTTNYAYDSPINTNGWKIGTFPLTDPYISASNQVRIHLDGNLHNNSYKIIIDQLALLYSEWKYPGQPSPYKGDAETPDQDGCFNVMWDGVADYDDYKVHRKKEIGGSWQDMGVQTSPYVQTDLLDGEWYYIVESRNTRGSTNSTALQIDVTNRPRSFTAYSDAENPDPNGDYTLSWDESTYATDYDIFCKPDGGSYGAPIGTQSSRTYDVIDQPDGNYWYIISARNSYGETNCTAINIIVGQSALSWTNPGDGQRIVFGTGDSTFNFTFSYYNLEEVELVVNGRNIGTVSSPASINLNPYNSGIDGDVEVILVGWRDNHTTNEINASLDLVFGKFISTERELFKDETEIVGNQLYMILHDPNGDGSFSTFTGSSTVSLGIDSLVVSGDAYGLDVMYNPGLFGVDTGESALLVLATSSNAEFDCRFEITNAQSITSEKLSTVESIGPGYGDIYWGETWQFRWQIYGTNVTYYNGTTCYANAELEYGVIRSDSVLLSDTNAPTDWRDLNAVNNGWESIDWIGYFSYVGGISHEVSRALTTTIKREKYINLSIDQFILDKLPGLESEINISLGIQMYEESAQTVESSYTIFDDDDDDYISMRVGFDALFGTYVFQTNSMFCNTSYPLEHNTHDYLGPIISLPVVELDSNGDGKEPYADDAPIITTQIFDEGGISGAFIVYSTDGGSVWLSRLMIEQVGNPGTWEGSLPTLPYGTDVLWYINVWDLTGNQEARKNEYGQNFNYTVLNSKPTVQVLYPNGGETLQGSVTIAWEGFDIDDDSITYDIYYNVNNKGWNSLAEGLISTSFNWDLSIFTEDVNVRIKIIARDSISPLPGEDESDSSFTVKSSTGPMIIIVAAVASVGVVAAIGTFVLVKKKGKKKKEVALDKLKNQGK